MLHQMFREQKNITEIICAMVSNIRYHLPRQGIPLQTN